MLYYLKHFIQEETMGSYQIILLLIIAVIYLTSAFFKKYIEKQNTLQRNGSNAINSQSAVRSSNTLEPGRSGTNAAFNRSDFMNFNKVNNTSSVPPTFNRPQPQQGFMYLNGVYVAIKDADKLNFLK